MRLFALAVFFLAAGVVLDMPLLAWAALLIAALGLAASAAFGLFVLFILAVIVAVAARPRETSR